MPSDAPAGTTENHSHGGRPQKRGRTNTAGQSSSSENRPSDSAMFSREYVDRTKIQHEVEFVRVYRENNKCNGDKGEGHHEVEFVREYLQYNRANGDKGEHGRDVPVESLDANELRVVANSLMKRADKLDAETSEPLLGLPGI